MGRSPYAAHARTAESNPEDWIFVFSDVAFLQEQDHRGLCAGKHALVRLGWQDALTQLLTLPSPHEAVGEQLHSFWIEHGFGISLFLALLRTSS